MEAGKSKQNSTSPLDFPPDMPNLFHLQHLRLQNVEPVYSEGQVHPAKPKLVEYWKATFYHRMPVGKGADGKTIYATTAGQYLSFTFKKIIHSLDAQLLPIYTAAARALQLPHGAVFDATTAVVYRLFGNVFLPVLRTTEGEVPMCEGAVRGEGRDADFKDFEIPQQYSGTFILLPKTGAFMSPDKKKDIIRSGAPDMKEEYQDIFSQGLKKDFTSYLSTNKDGSMTDENKDKKITQFNDLLKELDGIKDLKNFPLFVYVPDESIVGLVIMKVEDFKTKIPELMKINMDLSKAVNENTYYITKLTEIITHYKEKELFISLSTFEKMFIVEDESSKDGNERSGVIYSVLVKGTLRNNFHETTPPKNAPNMVTNAGVEVQPYYWKSSDNEQVTWEMIWENFPPTRERTPEQWVNFKNLFRTNKIICVHSHHLESPPTPSGADIKNYEGGDPILRVSKDSWCHIITATYSTVKNNERVSLGPEYRQLAIVFGTINAPSIYNNESNPNWEDTPNYHDFDQTQMLTLFFKDITKYVFLSS